MEDVIYGINGPVVTVKNKKNNNIFFSMMEMVYVGQEKLIGEVIKISDDIITIHVYEETTGLKPGDIVIGTGAPMKVLLGPGLLNNIFDGIERPLKEIEKNSGVFISRGSSVKSLDENKLWDTKILVRVGDIISQGTVYAMCEESNVIRNKCMLPYGIS